MMVPHYHIKMYNDADNVFKVCCYKSVLLIQAMYYLCLKVDNCHNSNIKVDHDLHSFKKSKFILVTYNLYACIIMCVCVEGN